MPDAFLDCHLCVVHPQNYLADMAAAGGWGRGGEGVRVSAAWRIERERAPGEIDHVFWPANLGARAQGRGGEREREKKKKKRVSTIRGPSLLIEKEKKSSSNFLLASVLELNHWESQVLLFIYIQGKRKHKRLRGRKEERKEETQKRGLKTKEKASNSVREKT